MGGPQCSATLYTTSILMFILLLLQVELNAQRKLGDHNVSNDLFLKPNTYDYLNITFNISF